MKATIVHESRGRMRLRLRQKTVTLRQADLLETWLKGQPWTKEASVHERTGCVIVTYTGERETVLAAIAGFTWAGAEETVTLPGHSTRALNRAFQEKLAGKVLIKGAAALFLPIAVSMGFTQEKLVAILVMLGSATTVSCFVMAKNMGHEGTLTSSTVMLTTLGSAFTLTGWLFLLRTLGLI